MIKSAIRSTLLVTTALAVAAPTVVQAQDRGKAAAAGALDDIIVSARRRDETSIAVPVVLTAVTGKDLVRRGINNPDELSQLVPGLTSSAHTGSIQGGTISLRGVAGPVSNPTGDQAVSFNIDGVQVAKSSVRRLGFMDLEQVEVLKGPQALFFGKNSPGGIISLRTADPTSHLAAKASVGYEIKAHEWRGEGFISGPLTDTLGARLAFYGTRMRGWVKVNSAPNNLLPPFHPYGPRGHEIDLRGTLKWEPTDAFSARLKIAYGDSRSASNAFNAQTVNCSLGTQQFPGVAVSDCKGDNQTNRTDNVGTSFTPYEPKFGNGELYSVGHQILGGLELNYKLNDSIDLTSVTGYYRTRFQATDSYLDYPSIPVLQFTGTRDLPATIAYQNYRDDEISEEVRANSHFDGPLNFTVGAIYSKTKTYIYDSAFAGITHPFELAQYLIVQKGKAWSVYGQARFDVTPKLELAAGGRYSHETKRLPLTSADFTLSLSNPIKPFAVSPDHITFKNFSPEVTATYRPTSRLTFFGSYKQGFLSGGFNSSLPTAGVPLNYGPEKIRGFEGGVKALLFDGTLRVNLSAFTYKAPGLQITAFDIVNGRNIGVIRNAGAARTKGIEYDMIYHTPIEGLTLRGALTYNPTRYLSYFGPCYTGQSQGQGCNLKATSATTARALLAGENGNEQNLAGRQLINAPRWAGNVGASYETALGSALKASFSGAVDFTSSAPTSSNLWVNSYSPKHALVSGTVGIADAENRWDVSLIGNNLTNKFFWSSGQTLQYTGAGPTGGVTPGTTGDTYAVVNRGREIMLRVTVSFGQ